MRILILIALLCNTAFSALYLNGATYTQTVTINHTSVSETNGHFLFQKKIPRTGSVALSVDSANNVGITKINDTIRIPRWVVFTTDTIFLYADIAVSSTVDTSYRIQYGKALKEVNASATFTNCGITNFWGFNETGSTQIDYAGGYNATLQNGATTGPGIFNKAYYNASELVSKNATVSGNLNLIGDITVTFFINLTTSTNFGRILANSTFNIQTVEPGQQIAVKSDGSTTAYSNANYPNGQWSLVSITRSAAGVTNIYRNGVLSGAANQSSGTPAAGGTQYYVGNATTLNRSINGYIDRIEILRNIGSVASFVDKYNMLFSPSTFSTLGTVLATEFSGEMGIDTLRLVCSAENAFTYQWYQNDTVKVGATDSVLTILADSLFYSKKQVIYCLVNGTIKSSQWIFWLDLANNRRSGYRQINLGQGMH